MSLERTRAPSCLVRSVFACVMFLATTGILSAGPYPAGILLVPSPFRVPHLISAQFNDFQNYNGVSYIHGGTDLGVPAGTMVYAPIDGLATVSRYIIKSQAQPPMFAYERFPIDSPASSTQDNAHLYVEVSFSDPLGRTWYFRHLDGRTIPDELLHPTVKPIRLHAGDPLGKVVTWVSSVTPEQRRYDHVHLEVTDWQGHFMNPNLFLPRPTDTTAPVIQQVWLLPNLREVPFTEVEAENGPVVNGTIDIVIDTFDQIDGSLYRHVPYEVSWSISPDQVVSPDPAAGVPEHRIYRFDHIPHADDRTFFANVFFQPVVKTASETHTCEGNNVSRRFLLHIANGSVDDGYNQDDGFNTRLLPDGRYVLAVTAKDIDGNAATRKKIFTIRNGSHRQQMY